MERNLTRRKRPRFLISPPDIGKVQIVLNIGPGVKLTPELEKSLEDLMRLLRDKELKAILQQSCDPLVECDPLICEDVLICSLEEDPPPCGPLLV